MPLTPAPRPPGRLIAATLAGAVVAALALAPTAPSHADDARSIPTDGAPSPTSLQGTDPPPRATTTVLTPLSLAIYPAQDVVLTFRHDLHLGAAEMTCVDCHTAAPTSTTAADRLLPPMQTCLGCHAIHDDRAESDSPHTDDRRPARCATCHPTFARNAPELPAGVDRLGEDNYRLVANPPPRPLVPAANLHFSHAAHADVDCLHCHVGVDQAGLASRDHLPSMALCLACHADSVVMGDAGPVADASPSSCATCHISGRDGRLVTELDGVSLAPTGRFRPDDHRAGEFARDHAPAARAHVDTCYACHAEAECTDCHAGVYQPIAIHPPLFVETHGIDAVADPDSCDSCHNAQDDCLECHRDVGLGEPSAPPVGVRFHPDGFVDRVDSPQFHGIFASTALTSCASCHTEDTCVACHAGIDPHPADFVERCGAMLDRNRTACAKCHLDVDSLTRLCR